MLSMASALEKTEKTRRRVFVEVVTTSTNDRTRYSFLVNIRTNIFHCHRFLKPVPYNITEHPVRAYNAWSRCYKSRARLLPSIIYPASVTQRYKVKSHQGAIP